MKAKEKMAEEYIDRVLETNEDVNYRIAFLTGFEKCREEVLKHVLKSILAAEGQPYIERRYVMAGDIEHLGEEGI